MSLSYYYNNLSLPQVAFDPSITNELFSLQNLLLAPVALSATVTLGLIVRYLIDSHNIRANGVPGPFLAKFSDLWLGWVAAQGHRSEVVHDLHMKYGPFVRIAPNHVSINSTTALHILYAHGNGALKSNFYDAFISIRPAIFSTRSRSEHARKRKIVAHTFSQKNVLDFEPHVRVHVEKLVRQWDRMCELGGVKGLSGPEGMGWGKRKGGKGGDLDGEKGDGRVWFDCLQWYNYLALDVISDLAVGSTFGLIDRGKDSVPVAQDQKLAMSDYSQGTCKVREVPAIKTLHERGEYSSSLGVLPPWLRPIVTTLVPWYSQGNQAVNDLAGMAVAAVSKRLLNPTDRIDILSRLQEGKDDEGKNMGPEELTAEAQTYIVAGTDTSANSTCVVTYYLALYPHIQRKLQAELDSALGPLDPLDTEPEVISYSQIKKLPYLDAVINETLRLFSTAGAGLPRVVGDEGEGEGMTILGKYFPPGTILSVPTYSIHRDKEIWGEDVESFRPERWLEGGDGDGSLMQKAFNPFSFGPRSCVGRNLANMDLRIFIATVFRRYDIVLEDPEIEVSEGFLRKPSSCRIGLKRRLSAPSTTTVV